MFAITLQILNLKFKLVEGWKKRQFLPEERGRLNQFTYFWGEKLSTKIVKG